METVILNGHDLSLEELYKIACDGWRVALDPEAFARLARSREVMVELAHGGKAIYGFNRGVGWNKDRGMDEAALELENQKIIRSHALGAPPYCSDKEVRAMMAIRLNQMLIGASCASDRLAELYRDFLNCGITPQVPRRGSVGEADITTITHIGMAFAGEADVSYRGQVVPAAQAMEAEGISPYCWTLKDAHTVMLSNCQGEALTALLVREAEALTEMSDLVFCLDYGSPDRSPAPPGAVNFWRAATSMRSTRTGPFRTR